MAQRCISSGITKSLVLKICEISRSSFSYNSRIEAKKVGRIFSKTTQKTIGGYDDNELIVKHIKSLLAELFVDYGLSVVLSLAITVLLIVLSVVLSFVIPVLSILNYQK